MTDRIIDAAIDMLRKNRGKKVTTSMFPKGISSLSSLQVSPDVRGAQLGKNNYLAARWMMAFRHNCPPSQVLSDKVWIRQEHDLLAEAVRHADIASDHGIAGDARLQQLINLVIEQTAAIGGAGGDMLHANAFLEKVFRLVAAIRCDFYVADDICGMSHLLLVVLECSRVYRLQEAICPSLCAPGSDVPSMNEVVYAVLEKCQPLRKIDSDLKSRITDGQKRLRSMRLSRSLL